MVGPFLSGSGLSIRLLGRPTSEPYLRMTLWLMQRLGFQAEGGIGGGQELRLTLPHDERDGQDAHLRAFEMNIEPDASGASSLLGAASLIPQARVRVPGLGVGSLQGDTRFAMVLKRQGAHSVMDTESVTVTGTETVLPVDVDLSDMPDTAMTAAAVACFARPTPGNPTATSTIRGLKTLRVKETDRLSALQTELSKIGATVEIFEEGNDEGLRVTPPHLPAASDLSIGSVGMAGSAGSLANALPAVHFDTYSDHRMAMALALIGLRRPNVFIRNPACVAKTYPGFWRDLAGLYARRR